MKIFAVGADRLVLLEDNSYDGLNSYATAYTLGEAIKRISDFNLIICGRQAADTDASVVGSVIVEMLGIPSITVARKITVNSNQVIIEHMLSDGYQVIQTPMPALITASNEIGDLRSASLPAIIASQKKESTVWSTQELRLEPSLLKRTRLLKLFQPARGINNCEIIEEENPQAAGVNLAMKLREAKII